MRSTAAAEYVALATTPVYEDNQPCIKIASNPIQMQRTKAIDLAYHIVRQYVINEDIKLVYTPTKLQRADLFTKILGRAQYQDFATEFYSF
mmetsp:Transcript_23981/g.35952  ORF Transcript_23981/g.35952 Transcript_23981/m.35952 type:complete len:91 (+) Transcript_23981:1993-2265(+)